MSALPTKEQCEEMVRLMEDAVKEYAFLGVELDSPYLACARAVATLHDRERVIEAMAKAKAHATGLGEVWDKADQTLRAHFIKAGAIAESYDALLAFLSGDTTNSLHGVTVALPEPITYTVDTQSRTCVDCGIAETREVPDVR